MNAAILAALCGLLPAGDVQRQEVIVGRSVLYGSLTLVSVTRDGTTFLVVKSEKGSPRSADSRVEDHRAEAFTLRARLELAKLGVNAVHVRTERKGESFRATFRKEN